MEDNFKQEFKDDINAIKLYNNSVLVGTSSLSEISNLDFLDNFKSLPLYCNLIAYNFILNYLKIIICQNETSVTMNYEFR